MAELKRVLEEFINGFDGRAGLYGTELELAAKAFSPESFARKLEQILQD